MLGIGNWLWIDEEAGGSWAQPGAVGTLDLSSYAQIETARKGQPRGVGMFRFANDVDLKSFTDAGGVILSADDVRDGRPDGKGLDAVEPLLGFRPSGDTWADCLWDCLTTGADPANLDAPGILVPTTSQKLELWFAHTLCRADSFDFVTHPHGNKLKAFLQGEFNAVRQLALDGRLIQPLTKTVDLEYHLRVADAICEKYAGRNPSKKAELFAELKPAAWDAGENLKPHATAITESFDKADSTTLGPDQSWSESGNAEVFSNQCRWVSGPNVFCYVGADLSGADHYAEVSVIDRGGGTNGFDGAGAIARKVASSTATAYVAFCRSNASNLTLMKSVSLAYTSLSSPSITISLPQVVRVTANGSTISADWNGSQVASVTDTAITSNLRTGLYFRHSGAGAVPIVDDFEASDLVASGLLYPQLERGIRGLYRGICLGMR